MSNGFVYVASLCEEYYKAAVRSAVSLKDHYPEAKITLFTHSAFLKSGDKYLFDQVVTNIPVHKRAKMWGMARTPYRKTLYLDSDTEIRSDNIRGVFDLLSKNDIMFTKIVPHVSAGTTIDSENDLEYHGGIILYNQKKHTIELIQEWYELFLEQHDIKNWKESRFGQYNPRMQAWDQFTMWYLLRQDKYKDIKHCFFPDGGHSYNFIYLLENDIPANKNYKDLEQIIYHYTIPRVKVNASNIKHMSRVVRDTN